MADVIAELVGRLGYQVDDKGLKQFDEGLGKAEKSAGRFEGSIAKGAKAVAALGVAAAAAAAAGLAKLVVQVAEAGDEIGDTATNLKIGTTELQRLRFAADKFGGSAASLDKAIIKLNSGLVDAASKGAGPTHDALKLLGVDIRQLEGLSTEERFGVIADAMAGIEDGAIKTALAAKLFGKSAGPELVGFLDAGSAGIEGMGDRLEDLGGVMSEDAIEASGKFDDALKDLKAAAFGAGAQLVQGLTPAVTDGVESFSAWIAENDEFIRQDLPAVLTAIAEATVAVVGFFAEAIAQVDDFATEIQHLGEDIYAEYGPAIDFVIDTGKTLAGIWVDIASAIGKGILKLLEFAGVIDDVEDTVFSIKVGLGIADEPTATARGTAGIPGEQGDAGRARAAAATAEREAAEASLAAQKESLRAAESLLRQQQRTRTRGLTLADIEGKGKKGRGGGKGSKGPSDADLRALAEAKFGAQLDDLARRSGATPQARAAAALAAGQALQQGAAEKVALEAGVGQIESLTGEDLGAVGLGGDIASALFGERLGGQAGGGDSPTAGAKFVQIDASFNAPTTIEINLPEGALAGMSPHEIAQVVEDRIGEALDERNRRAFDHFSQAVRT